MSETRWTPGLWMVQVWKYPRATPPRQELNIQTNELLLATVQCDFTGANPFTVPEGQARANAQLMRTAPKLYRALEAMLEAYAPNRDESDRTHLHSAVLGAIEALAVARGECYGPCIAGLMPGEACEDCGRVCVGEP